MSLVIAEDSAAVRNNRVVIDNHNRGLGEARYEFAKHGLHTLAVLLGFGFNLLSPRRDNRNSIYLVDAAIKQDQIGILERIFAF